MFTREAFRIDGRLDERVWQRIEAATAFEQRVPNGGAAASQPTEVRIAYDAQAIYVGVRAHDRAPDSIAQQLGRRDAAEDLYTDQFLVAIDSYGDRRTAFAFGTTPRGLLYDMYLFNDDGDDDSWDAVWNVASTIDSAGWTAEFRIPLSQLRYDVNGAVGATRPWGINFLRVLARHGEEAFWAPTPADAPGIVSRFGTLTGLDSLRPPSRTEIIPYIRTQVETQPPAARNAFVSAAQGTIAAGGDVRIKLPQSLTMTATINPDFGQVEADPAVVNLSAFEVFFPERRPFFLENADGFAFGRTRTSNDNDPPTFFYSRRIGRAPQRPPSGSDLDAVGISSRTPISGALKLSGTTPSGWQIGVVNAVTPREAADVQRTGDRRSTEPVEPLSNYHVSRVRRLFRGGNSGVGAFFSDTRRALDDSVLRVRLPQSATVVGFDAEHAWQQRTWTVSGVHAESRARGDVNVITRLQRANYRLYQRPDATHLRLDPTRTALGGAYSALSLAKTAGERLLASVTYEQTTPGFETNDLGFQVRGDFRTVSTSVEYRNPVLSKFAREWSVEALSTHSDNFGGNRIEERYALNYSAVTLGFWELAGRTSLSPRTLNDRLLRGGPLAERPRAWQQNLELSTDARRTLIVNAEASLNGDASGATSRSVEAGLDWRPLPQARVRLSPAYSAENSTDQYVQAVSDTLARTTFGRRYVFADVRRREVRLNTRVDWTFSPWLSLQVFLQPFASSGEFRSLKEFTTPRAFRFARYGVDVGSRQPLVCTTTCPAGETVDPDGPGGSPAFFVPLQDFTVRALRGNAVLRWEYQPGSSLFFVWSQQREYEQSAAERSVTGQLGRALGDAGQHVFLIKFSRWIGRPSPPSQRSQPPTHRRIASSSRTPWKYDHQTCCHRRRTRAVVARAERC